MADAEAGSDAQQAGSGAGTFTQTGHKVDVGADEAMAAGVANFQQSLASHQLEILTNAHKFNNEVFSSSLDLMNERAKLNNRASELSIDRWWNVDEVSGLTAKLPTDLQGLSTIMTQAVAAMVAKINEVAKK